MKKYFLLALVVLTGIASSCKYDDDDLWENVNDLADRVTSLEAATKQMNSDIAAMQSIISALQNQVTVSKVEELKDGYIIHFSDGTKATIKNGADGKDGANGADGKDGANGENGKDGKDGANAPIINVKQEGGVYYWTITVDGKTEWLTDEDGNKLRVSGEDGEDGKDGTSGSSGKNGNTPLLKVNDGYWMVSYDNGTTYANVKDVNGTPVKAEGNDGEAGDSKFTSINKSGDKVVIVFDGKTYEIPLAASVTYSGTGIDGDVVTLAPKTSVTLNYELSEMLNASVEVVKAPDFVAVEAGNGKLTIKAKSAFTEPGKIVLLYYNANKTITSVLTVKVETEANNVDELKSELQKGGTIVLGANVEANEVINLGAATLDGNEKTLSFTKSTNTQLVNTTGGIIKNLKIQGYGERNNNGKVLYGVFSTDPTDDIVIENVEVKGVAYPLNVQATRTSENKLTVSNSTLIGWTSFTGLASARFTDCHFGIGTFFGASEDPKWNGCLKPFVSTIVEDCSFESGFHFNFSEISNDESVVFTNCKCGETIITKDNFTTYFTMDGTLDNVSFN